MTQTTDNVKKFKVYSLRTVKSPSIKDVTTYNVLVGFMDLPTNIPMDVNPRIPKMNTSVAKQLIAAVESPTPGFEINNRGIVIRAKSVSLDTSNSELTVDLGDDNSKYGILDGGHTYKAITEHRNDSSEYNKFVKLEILVGDSLDVSNIADARNTSVQVSDIALFELDNKFDFVKEAIKDEPYAEDVAYKDNDNKPIPISDLLRLMFAFNIKRYPNDVQVPISAYSGKAAVFKDYSEEYSKEDNIYKNLAPLLPDLVKLYEKIETEISAKYLKYKKLSEGKRGQFGKVRGVKNGGETRYNHTAIEFDTSSGYIMPIFGAFRALLKQKDDGSVEWYFDPLDVWEKTGVSLVQNTFDTSTQPQLNGKSKTLWQANYRIVDGVKKDMLIDEMMKSNSL